MDLGIRGKKALIGGASMGLGLAAAQALAAEGCEVAIVSRSRENLEAARRKFPSPQAVHPIVADLATSDGVDACIRQADLWASVDILVNNTGGPPPGRSMQLDDDAWRRANESLVLYVKKMCDHFVPPMRARKWGRVVTITSLTVREPVENLVLSNVYRAGLTAYLKGLAREVAADGVTVNSVLPGAYLTERYAQLIEGTMRTSGRSREDVTAELLSRFPQSRFQQPEELGAVVAFLASAKATAVTGAAVPAEGGMLRGMW